MDYSVHDLFRVKFSQTIFDSKEDFDKYAKEADDWWKKNHLETPDEYKLRIEYFNRPSIGGIILEDT